MLVARFAALRSLVVVAAAMLLGGCVVSLIGAKAGETLSAAILNQSDPELVAGGVPAYLLIVDGLISQHPDNPALLSAGAQMFALYGSRFAPHDRAIALTEKARRYGQKALCLVHEPSCHWQNIEYDQLVAELKDVNRKKIGPLYAYAVGWLANLNATSEDWSAVGDLPWVQAVLERVVELDDAYEDGAAHGYLGILNALRPPALGGKPDLARQHFERAIELSKGRDLSIKVEYARRYARLVFDQELHDRLLTDVLNAPAEAQGHTLFNVLAKKEAAALLATSKEYF
ncbi:MAG TPA: TRAP transporter TatT component family protein [Gammaproteobacteria bacterium]|nr:TRAP transporter TatT component family protein [Gammaproteobacteria bacterium]